MAYSLSISDSSNGIVLDNTSAAILSGGVVTNTTVNSGGLLSVRGGGSASVNMINASGKLYVSEGGTADTTTVHDGGVFSVFVGGEANITTVNSGGQFAVANATVDNTTVNSDGQLYVYKGGTLHNTVIDDFGYCYALSATMNSTTVNFSGKLVISGGGLTDCTTVNSGGLFYLYYDGTTDHTTVNSGGIFYLSSGTAIRTTVSSGGTLRISSKGKLTGQMTFQNGAIVSAFSGATLDFDLTSAVPGGSAFINNLSLVKGTPTYTLTVNGTPENGDYILAGGAAGFNGTISVVNTSGEQLDTLGIGSTISYSGVDYTLSLNESALTLSVSARAPIIVSSGAAISYFASVNSGEAYLDMEIIGPGELYVSSGGVAINTTVRGSSFYIEDPLMDDPETGIGMGGMPPMEDIFSGFVHVEEGGKVSNTIIYEHGELNVDGGSANIVTVNSEGNAIVSGGGSADHVTVNEYGCFLLVDASVDDITISSGGVASFSSGAAATNIIAVSGARLILSAVQDTYLQGTMEGKAFKLENAIVSGLVVSGNLYVPGGGRAQEIQVGNSGYLTVYSGGVVENVSGQGSIRVIGGTVNSVLISSGGVLNCSSGGIASNINILSGSIYLSGGAIASDVIIDNGDFYLQGGGTANNILLNGGAMIVRGACLANGVTVQGSADIVVRDGGIISGLDIRHEGWYRVSSGGTIADVAMQGNTDIVVSNGGKITGRLTIESGAIVSAFSGAVFDFDISHVSAGGTALVNNLSLVQGTPIYTLTVSGIQAAGTYVLAEGAAGFNSVITVLNTFDDSSKVLAVGGTVTVQFADYSLSLVNGSILTLNVSEREIPDYTAPIVWNVRADTTELTTSSVYITAEFEDDVELASAQYRIGEDGEWTDYPDYGVEVSENATVYFRAIDAAGNISEIESYTVENILPPDSYILEGSEYDVYCDERYSTIIVSGGWLNVFFGGVVDQVVIKDGGRLDVWDGGTVGNLQAPSDAYLSIHVSPETYIAGTIGESTILIQDGFVSGFVVDSSHMLDLYAGASANNTTVNQGGWFYVYADGLAENTVVNSDGEVNLYGYATANGITINDGTVKVSACAVATNIDWTPFEGNLHIENGARVTFSNPLSGIYFGSRNQLVFRESAVLSTALESSCEMYVMSGGIATVVSVDPGGYLFVGSGGSAVNVKENGGNVFLEEGANVTFVPNVLSGVSISYGKSASIHSMTVAEKMIIGGKLYVMSGATATDTLISGGRVAVLSGGLVTGTTAKGSFEVYSGGTANNTIVEGEGTLYVSSGGTANDTTVSRGNLFVYRGGTVNSTMIAGRGTLNVSSGGTANAATVDSGAIYLRGGEVNDTVIKARGGLYLFDESGINVAKNVVIHSGGSFILYGGKVTGRMTFENGAVVSAYESAILDFNITGMTPGETALVDTLSLVQGAPIYTLTVSNTQAAGSYTLAGGAAGFNGTISVQTKPGETFGFITVGETLAVGQSYYTLSLDTDDTLILNVSGTVVPDAVSPTVSDIQADITAPTNRSVVVTAVFADDVQLSSAQYRLGGNGEWTDYPVGGVVVSENATVYFRAIDGAGNVSEIASYTVDNIDKVAPSAPGNPVALADGKNVFLSWEPSSDASGIKQYIVMCSRNGASVSFETDNTSISIPKPAFGVWSWSVQAVDNVGNRSSVIRGEDFEVTVDLSVSGFLVPETISAGETALFRWTVTNNGFTSESGVRQSLYVVNAADPERKTLLKTVYLADIPEYGESSEQSVEITWNDKLGFTDSYFQIALEADGDVTPDDNTAVSASQYHFEQKLSIEKLADTITENSGRIRVVAKRTGSPDLAVSAVIEINDSTGLLSVPETISFAAGESEKVFYLTVGDNAEYQGDKSVRIRLQAEGYQSYSKDIVLTDDEIPELSFEIGADEVTEGESFETFGKVKLNTALDHDLRVKLTYDKAQLSGIPDYVVIKAGQTEAAFALSVVDDAVSEIDKTVKITASADGVISGRVSLLVKDNDIPAIALSVDKTVVSENAGVYALVGTITRTDNTVNYVKVKFTDANNAGLILPSVVTLGTGEKSVNFHIGIKDNSLVDGDRVATVNASIYIDSCGCTVQPVSGETQVSFTILDEDGEALGLSLSRSNVAENTVGAAKLTITRNTVNGDALTVNLNVAGSTLLDLPETVQFAAGENAVTIDVNTLTDGINTGNQMAVITASAEGYASAVGYLNISDVDLPDFEVASVSVGDSQVYAGKSTLVTLTLLNSGFSDHSGSVNVKLTLSDGTELGTYKVNGPFEAGGTKEVSFYVNMPEVVGSRTVSAVVDPDNRVSELNKGNNTGVSAAFEVKLDYIVTVETEPEVLYTKAPLTVSGTTRKLNGDAIGNMPVEVMLKALTGEKIVKTVSDAEGNYTLTLDTSDLYAGSYSVYAGNLGGFGQEQDRVEIAGMKVNQPRTAFTWDVENLTATEGSFTVSNLSGVALSGVTIRAVNAPDNFVFVADEPAALDANGQLTVNYTITAAGETEGGGYELVYGWQKINFVAESDEGVTAEFSGYFYSNPRTAMLTLSETQDVRTLYSGGEYFYEFRITNTGFGDSGEISLNLPGNDLVKLISNPVIENLAYGESTTVTLKINPAALGDGLALNAAYSGSIGISAENADATGFDFGYTFVSNDKGNITITMTDEWTQYAADRPMLSGAKVGVYNAYTEKLVATGYTDENGIVNFNDLAEGKYILKYSADKHNNAQEVVTVRGGETLELNTFLQVSTVKYTWDVRKVELTDTYEIVLSTEFETNVPAPVVTIDGPTVLPELAYGESTLMNFTVTNHGLIAAMDFSLDLPELGNGYTWHVLNDQPMDIAPNSAIVVSVKLERKTSQTDSYTVNGITYFKVDKNGKPVGQSEMPEEYYISGYDRNDRLVSFRFLKDGIITEYTYNSDGTTLVEKTPNEYYIVDGIKYYKKDLDGNILFKDDETTDSFTEGFDENGKLVSYSFTIEGETTSYTYDANEKPVTLTSPDGTVSVYTYDNNGNLSSITENDITRYYVYSEDGKYLLSHTDEDGNISTYTYDIHGNLTSQTFNDIQTEVFVYSEDGNRLISYTDEDGMTVSYEYYENGTIHTETYSDGEIYTYDSDGRLTTSVDSDGIVATYSYDESGMRSRVSFSDGSSYIYGSNGKVSSYTNSNGVETTYSYDEYGNTTKITRNGQSEIYTYDETGTNLLSRTAMNGDVTSYVYDENGNRIQKNNPDGSVYIYDTEGKVVSYTTAVGDIFCYEYDENGTIASVTNSFGETRYYEHDDSGNLTKFTDANGNITIYTYDDNSKPVEITYADGTSDRYFYDDNGQQVKWIGRAGQTAEFAFNSDNNLISATYSDGTLHSYAYDTNGNLITADDIALTYDGENSIIGLSFDDGRKVNYFTTVDGLFAGYMDESGHGINYSYTDDGLYDRLTDESGALIVDYDYSETGYLLKETKGNGTYTNYSYDENGRLAAMEHFTTAGVLESYVRYTYDSAGLRIAMETQDGAWAYAYDVKDQLTGAVFTDKGGQVTQEFSYEYDAMGNRTKAVENGVVTTYVYNNLNQIVSANGFEYRYDANGNLLEDEKRTYTWTADNRVASETLKSTGQVWEYGYDALGNRVSSKTNGVTTTWTVDESGNVLAEYVDGVWSRTYYQGNLLAGFTDKDGNTYYFNSDALGTTLSVTGGNGTAVNSYAYDPFGNILNSTEGVDNDFTFVGGFGLMKNDSGTFFVRARNYDPATGRWISADPIGIDGGENLYAYVANDPISNCDVLGLLCPEHGIDITSYMTERLSEISFESDILGIGSFIEEALDSHYDKTLKISRETSMFSKLVSKASSILVEAIEDGLRGRKLRCSPKTGQLDKV